MNNLMREREMRNFIQAAMTGTLLALAATAVPVQAGDRDWRDRERASPREVERSWRRVQEERRDLARAQWRGDRGDIREESRELRRAEREFRQDRADLYRAGWGGGWDDDRRRGRDWDDDRRGRGRDRDWDRGNGRWGRDYDDRWDDGWRRGGWDNDWGWRGPPPWARANGRRAQDWAWRRDGWNRQGWHAENFYVDNRRYRPRVLGYNDPIWRGYDNRYYCRRSDGTTGLIVGGLTGGVLGNVIAPGGSKVLGSIIGGSLGAVLGQSADRGRVVCR
jgi:hypothetical protein